MISPPAQRVMSERAGATVSETAGSHAAHVSRPAVAIAHVAQGSSGQPQPHSGPCVPLCPRLARRSAGRAPVLSDLP
jgi:hypothetical protein